MPDGVTGNTSDFGSEESRFEPWSGNQIKLKPCKQQFYKAFFIALQPSRQNTNLVLKKTMSKVFEGRNLNLK